MMTFQLNLHSPLSPVDFVGKNNQVLLLLFIFKELVRHPTGVIEGPAPTRAPFDWTLKSSSAEKIREYFSLLPFAFPELASHVDLLNQNIYLPANELTFLLEPYILACASNENLLLFLLQHQNELAVKPLLDKICPEGLDVLKEKITSGFRQRGYPFIRWTHSSKTP